MLEHMHEIIHIAVSDLREARLLFDRIQNDEHDHVAKDEKKRLHDIEDVSFHNLAEHLEKSNEVDHEQKDFMINENASITVRFAHECSFE